MEGVGARLGRSSTRYGPTTVFTGPVRRWKKRWVHVLPSSNNNSAHHNGGQFHSNLNSNGTAATAPGAANGNHSSSHVLLYKWTPLTQSNNSNTTTTSNKESGGVAVATDDAPEEPQRRKCKYIPVALLEAQRLEADEEMIDSEVKPSDGDGIADDPVSTSAGVDEKPDINESPKESQDDEQVVRQDLNESTLDLCLELNSHDHDSESKPEELGETKSVQVDDSVPS
ncbi:unnamed protein product [Linum tenue]|uniref:Uncharacterized protein n=1 Tax=Linum tenue TaxID=586396 RepID=A0AAV0PBH3_9ROSI|nr:unnamed protein product [Linum tenue]